MTIHQPRHTIPALLLLATLTGCSAGDGAGDADRLLDLNSRLFDPFEVVSVDITLPEVSIESLAAAPRVYVPCMVTFTVDGESSQRMEAGIRIKGKYGSSRPLNRKAAFKLKLDFTVPGQSYLGIRKLTLNNMVQDTAKVHEAVGYSMFRALGIPCPRTGYAWVTVNGEDYGLYANIETMDEVFLSRFYEETTHLYEGEYGVDVVPGDIGRFEIDEGDPNNVDDLVALTEAAQAEDDAWLESIAPYVDLEQMTRMWLVEQYIGHWDGYAPTINNYYLHSDGDGRFTMLPWGLDQTFSDKRDVYKGRGHLFARCMRSRACRNQYQATLIAFLPVLDALDLVPFIEALSEFLQPWIEADPRLEYGFEDVPEHVASTIDFLLRRRESIGALADCLADPDSDQDGDGYRCQWDCDDGDPGIYLGAKETCGDGVDQSCSGVADDGYDCPDCVPVFRGSRRYLFCSYPRPFAMAGPHCADEGSKLAIINDADENQWLQDQLNHHSMGRAWLGINDREEEGVWLWSDGSEPEYLNWRDGEPNDSGGEDCTQLLPSGFWNDIKCGLRYRVICED